MIFSDDEEDTLPSNLDDLSPKFRSIPHSPAASPGSPTKGKRTDSCLYNMSIILASVAMGFDIGIANTRAMHPNLHTPSGDEDRSTRKRDSYINNRRDAYLAAVRDSFIEPEGDFRPYQAAPSGYWHTYHGVQQRLRPGIPAELDLQSPAAADNDFGYHATGVAYNNYNARTTSHRSSYADSEASGVSSTTPTTERTVIYNRQLSSESNFDAPLKPSGADVGNKAQRRSVTFEDDFIPPDYSKMSISNAYNCHRRTPSDTSNSLSTFDQQDIKYGISLDYYHGHQHDYPAAPSQPVQQQQPVPPRRRSGTEPAQRPTTLNVGTAGVTTIHLKYPASPGYGISPARERSHGSEDYVASHTGRSHMSPGSTPPHISHQKTLLDIDVEGQNQDVTRPLVQHMGGTFSAADLGNSPL